MRISTTNLEICVPQCPGTILNSKHRNLHGRPPLPYGAKKLDIPIIKCVGIEAYASVLPSGGKRLLFHVSERASALEPSAAQPNLGLGYKKTEEDELSSVG